MSELEETVARAICEANLLQTHWFHSLTDDGKREEIENSTELWEQEARAAIAAMPMPEPGGWQPIGLRYLEDLAKDCEECAADACNDGDKGLKRSWLSVAYRIRHAVKALAPAPEAQP
ncbi:MAG: hypothetical protein NT113_22865 [Hyphomicrobiales bacterium]|nr:hypothetical protein [Hyphomicrobiales bacterium]